MWRAFRVIQKGYLIREAKFKPSLHDIGVGDGKHGPDSRYNQYGRHVYSFACQIQDNSDSQAPLGVLSENERVKRARDETFFDVHYEKPIYEEESTGKDQRSGFSSSDNHQKTENKGEADNEQAEQDRDCKWENWTKSFQHDMFLSNPSYHVLEAVGWGTAVVSGIRMSHLFQCSKNREDGVHQCWLKRLQKVAISAIKQRLLQFETGIFSSTIRCVLPQGSFNSLPIAASGIQDVNKELSTKSVGTNSDDLHFENKNDFWIKLVSEDVSTKASSAVKQFAELQYDASKQPSVLVKESDLSQPDFEVALKNWDVTVKSLEAMIKNAEGVHEAHQGNMDEAIRLWKCAIAEEAECVQAHFNLGLSYERGHGVSQNFNKALEHYQHAAKKDHPASLYNSAMIHLRRQSDTQKNRATALLLLEKAAELGLKEAQRELGVLYTESPERDMRGAAAMFQKAADQGDVKALYFLGVCYENGWGVEHNKGLAIQLYEKAAACGHCEALFNLEILQGVGKDKKKVNLSLSNSSLKPRCPGDVHHSRFSSDDDSSSDDDELSNRFIHSSDLNFSSDGEHNDTFPKLNSLITTAVQNGRVGLVK